MRLVETPAKQGISVLYGHRIMKDIPAGPSPYAHTAITPEFLEGFLQDHADWQALSINDLYNNRYDPERPAFALTFDDGYRDMLVPLLGLLEKYHTPAAIFLCHDFCYADLEPFEQDFAARLTPDQTDLYERERIKLKRGSLHKRKKILDDLIAQYNLGDLQTRTPFLSADDIAVLNSHPLITLGHHGRTHALLSRLNPALLWRELKSPYKIIAYPYGGQNMFVRVLCALKGYKMGFAAGNRVYRPEIDNPFNIPRIELSMRATSVKP